MKRDMNNIMTRLFAVITLMIFSMGAKADVKVEIGKFNGGTIVEKSQTAPNANGLVTVTITVTPDKGFTIKQTDIVVVSTYAPDASDTRSPKIAAELTLLGTDPKDLSDPRDYTFIVGSSLGAWVKEANFQQSGSKGNRDGQTVIEDIDDLNDITATGNYIITKDIDDASGFSTIESFSGTLEAAIDPDTHMPYRIKNLSAPLFTTLTGTVKNLVLEEVDISGNTGNTGAIACEASGDARIYNVGILSGSVGGTAYTGGLVGLLDGKARVVNCYSFADITGGSEVGGIVGHNNVATTSANLKTMVFCCMFYGDISENITNKAPIYNGEIITNVSTGTGNNNKGVSNFNYFRLEASYVKPTGVTYNCALGAEDRFLKRFEFYRHLLNSHRELAGWWATGTYSNSEMMKWVLEPEQIGSSTPYPILKTSGRYRSVVYIDDLQIDETTHNGSSSTTSSAMSTLSVTIQMGDGGAVYGPPAGAAITIPSLTLNITDKDPEHYNFNYYKVQLPYYNDVGTKNYTGNRVVTGWKIVSITGGTEGSFTKGDDATANAVGEITAAPYNFADRHCTNKDLYDEGDDGSDRVFNQGAYWDVPEGVTAITIEPYWAKCVYLADQNADKVYNQAMTTGYDVPNVGGGQIYTNGNSYSIAGENQVVYTTIGNAIASSGTALFAGVTATSHTVYDYAVVLVGNSHNYNSISADNTKPYTVTSIDLDGDNEPDYSYILRFDSRKALHPVRVDFINIPGLGMAQKSTGGTGSYNFGIFQPKYWFESTNTSLFRVTQFEYDKSDRVAAPYIVQGGVIEQWVNGQSGGAANKTTYFHVGGNVWFKEFHRGTHQDVSLQSKHPPISVTGGDYDEFYLTGLYTANVESYGDNAECYINGGRFGTVCGAAMEGIGKTNGADNTGNITWQIQNADIDEFYAGGINAAERKIAEGNLTTVVEGGYIKLFCGGPKFGDMNTGKTVFTTATGCTFDTFFGAGYGGNAYSRQAPRNHSSLLNFPHSDNSGGGSHSSWNNWLQAFYKQEYSADYGGVSTQFSYQFLPQSGNTNNVARIFIDYVKFSLATTHNVSSKLTDCTITGNFYGGGSLGKVDGDVTSVLDGCTVKGSVFGAGFSADRPNVVVDAIGFEEEPYYYTNLGTYRTGTKYFDDPDYVHTEFKDDGTPKYAPTTYTWVQGDANSTVSINTTDHTLSTPENLAKSNLGSVNGNVTLTIKGDSKIGTDGNTTKGNVFGGGESSYVTGAGHKVIVTLAGKTQVLGNVYGGGDSGVVEGSTEVNIQTTVDD